MPHTRGQSTRKRSKTKSPNQNKNDRISKSPQQSTDDEQQRLDFLLKLFQEKSNILSEIEFFKNYPDILSTDPLKLMQIFLSRQDARIQLPLRFFIFNSFEDEKQFNLFHRNKSWNNEKDLQRYHDTLQKYNFTEVSVPIYENNPAFDWVWFEIKRNGELKYFPPENVQITLKKQFDLIEKRILGLKELNRGPFIAEKQMTYGICRRITNFTEIVKQYLEERGEDEYDEDKFHVPIYERWFTKEMSELRKKWRFNEGWSMITAQELKKHLKKPILTYTKFKELDCTNELMLEYFGIDKNTELNKYKKERLMKQYYRESVLEADEFFLCNGFLRPISHKEAGLNFEDDYALVLSPHQGKKLSHPPHLLFSPSPKRKRSKKRPKTSKTLHQTQLVSVQEQPTSSTPMIPATFNGLSLTQIQNLDESQNVEYEIVEYEIVNEGDEAELEVVESQTQDQSFNLDLSDLNHELIEIVEMDAPLVQSVTDDCDLSPERTETKSYYELMTPKNLNNSIIEISDLSPTGLTDSSDFSNYSHDYVTVIEQPKFNISASYEPSPIVIPPTPQVIFTEVPTQPVVNFFFKTRPYLFSNSKTAVENQCTTPETPRSSYRSILITDPPKPRKLCVCDKPNCMSPELPIEENLNSENVVLFSNDYGQVVEVHTSAESSDMAFSPSPIVQQPKSQLDLRPVTPEPLLTLESFIKEKTVHTDTPPLATAKFQSIRQKLQKRKIFD